MPYKDKEYYQKARCKKYYEEHKEEMKKSARENYYENKERNNKRRRQHLILHGYDKCICGNKKLKTSELCMKCALPKRMKNNKIWDNPQSKKYQFKKGNSSPFEGKTKDNCGQLKSISERMKNGGALKARKGNRLKPNKPEIFLNNLIKKNNLPFNYTGNGAIWFKGLNHSFNPDFLSKNPRHIIEVFGDYWHNLPGVQKKDKERLKTYKKYGYKSLVVWQHELKNPDQVINKINKFIYETTSKSMLLPKMQRKVIQEKD